MAEEDFEDLLIEVKEEEGVLEDCGRIDKYISQSFKDKLMRAAYIGARFVINDQIVEGLFAYYPYFLSVANGTRYLRKKYGRDLNKPDSELEDLVQ